MQRLSSGSGYKAITFCIDALDECDHVDSLLINLREIHKTLSTRCRVKFMVSSRRDVTVGNTLALDFEMLDLDNPSLKLTKLELNNFVRTQVLERESLGIGARLLNGHHRMLEESLVDTITWQSQGMFLWAKLQLAIFFPSRPINTPEEVEERIRKLWRSGGDGLTPDLNLVYDQIYMANTTWDRTIASRAYEIVLGACTGISMECLAAIIRYRSSSTHDECESINPDLIQRICGNFLVEDQNDIVIFSHQSVREYLLQRPGAEYSPSNVHAQLATSCLWLLNRHLLKSVDGSFGQGIGPHCQPSLDPHSSSSEDGHPEADLPWFSRPLLLRGVYDLNGKVLDFDSLFGYASIFWADHFSKSGLKNRVSGGVLDLLLKQFITGEDKDKWSGNSRESTPFTRWQSFINSLERIFENNYDPLRDAGSAIDPPNPIVLVTIWGLTEVLDHITPELPVFGYQTSRGKSLLALAVEYTQKTSVLQSLLDRGAGIDEINIVDGRTAIHTAAKGSNNDAVKFLMGRQANLKIRGTNCDASLIVDAARKCSAEILEVLLEKWDDDEDIYGALASACGRGDFNNVAQVLARFTPDALETWLKGQPDGGTFAVQQAAAAGNNHAITALLEAGATINLAGKDWTTPLQSAVKQRDVEMFSTLLGNIPHRESPDIALGSTLRCIVWEAIGFTDPYIQNRHFNIQDRQIVKEFVDFLLDHGAVSSRDLDSQGDVERHGL
ncbi:ankyrin [Trichocladium antarcticum]|uniref:Ankyrin n=1 Tax=Trichocladium antarcticum TaxID=1450529 RepID=A0AAN6UHZ9_9PEZI|nr:ankyrin [Trichocladium antarcticum]